MKIYSAIRPTGPLHIGHYFGVIRQWLKLQEKEDCVFSIADLHAITTPYKPEKMQENIREIAITYLAAGLDPEKSIFFVQSEVGAHTELAWLLGTITPLGELKRMTQFKEKSKENPNYVNAGLLNYPLLMAADILLYQTEFVPVGKDQTQHVELTRFIARKFNKQFGKVFTLPKVLLAEKGEKIQSLVNPRKKMSKTGKEKGCIWIFEEPESIKKKIMAAVTDTGKEIKYNPERKPGISNLLTIYSLISNLSIKELEKKFQNATYQQFKKSLAEELVEFLRPLREKREKLSQRRVYLEEILKKGKEKAQKRANSTLTQVKSKMGLL